MPQNVLVIENSDKDLGLKLILECFKVYVDDQSSIQDATPLGAIYDNNENKIVINEEQSVIDKNVHADRRTANLLVSIANSLDPSIVMEASVPSDFQNKKLPLLNCQVWIDRAKRNPKIRYEHYEKPMANILEVQKESAMPNKMKRATLVQGGITRLLNTSIELGEVAQNEILSKYMKKLQSSNYEHKERIQILKAIKKGWKSILKKAETGERPLHRKRSFNRDLRIVQSWN